MPDVRQLAYQKVRQAAQDFRQAAEPFGRLAAEHLGLAAEPGPGGKEMAWSDTTRHPLPALARQGQEGFFSLHQC